MNDFAAVLFDLDGTLVQTERLKAISYARAALVLSDAAISEDAVIEAFKDVVGRSRYEVAESLLHRFGLARAATRRMEELGVDSPIEAFVRIRMQFYERMMADPAVIKNSVWLHNMSQLRRARRAGKKTGLATMSYRPQAMRVIEVLEIGEAFDAIATRDDVQRGKPDPEIYHLLAKSLDVREEDCLVFEDSVSGVEAALAAGMHVVAVSTPFTRDSLLRFDRLLPEQRVFDPAQLDDAVARLAARRRSEITT